MTIKELSAVSQRPHLSAGKYSHKPGIKLQGTGRTQEGTLLYRKTSDRISTLVHSYDGITPGSGSFHTLPSSWQSPRDSYPGFLCGFLLPLLRSRCSCSPFPLPFQSCLLCLSPRHLFLIKCVMKSSRHTKRHKNQITSTWVPIAQLRK